MTILLYGTLYRALTFCDSAAHGVRIASRESKKKKKNTTRKYTTLSVSANKERKRVKHTLKNIQESVRVCVWWWGGCGRWGIVHQFVEFVVS